MVLLGVFLRWTNAVYEDDEQDAHDQAESNGHHNEQGQNGPDWKALLLSELSVDVLRMDKSIKSSDRVIWFSMVTKLP